jgi:chromosome segregation ATPase
MANTTKKYVSLEKLGFYDGKIKEYIGTKDTELLNSAKKYVDDAVALCDQAGAAATAEQNAKAYADGKDAAIQAAQKAADDAAAAASVADGKAVAAQTDVDNLEAYVGTFTATEGVDTVVKYIDAKTADIATGTEFTALKDRVTQAEKDIDAIEADYLKAADKTELQGNIDTLAGTHATDKKNLEDAIAAVEQTHATDKAALEDAIALKADQTALDAVSAVANAAVKQTDYDTKVAALEAEDARIAGLVEAEAAKAREEEGKLDARLVEVETFFKTAEGETIDQAMDTLVEIQKYITEDGAAADEMVKDIAANAKAIEDMDAAYKAADEELQGAIDAVEGRMDTAEGDIDALEGRMTTAESDIDAVEGRMTTAEGAITALQQAIGEGGSVDAQIDAKIAELDADVTSAAVEAGKGVQVNVKEVDGKITEVVVTGNYDNAYDAKGAAQAAQTAAEATAAADATAKANKALEDAKKYADDEDAKIEQAIADLEAVVDTKAAQADLTALDGRVTTAESDIDSLEGRMTAVETKASANETEIAKKADKATTLAGYGIEDAYTKTEVDAAITAAMATIVECSEQEITDLFA